MEKPVRYNSRNAFPTKTVLPPNGSYVQCSWWNDTIRHKRQTGEIIGLSYQEIQQLNSILANIATNLLRPVIYIQTETVIVDERSLLIAHIAEGDNKPYKDLNGIIWTKQGADKRKVMENSEIMRLFQCSGILYADEQPIPFTSEKISTDMLWTTLSAKNMVAKKIHSVFYTQNFYTTFIS